MGTVLVVEDSPSAREVVMRILRREGYDAIGASNGVEALNVVHDKLPDLMLLDVMMPEMDGMTLLSRLRDHPQFKELPVIVLSALSDDARVRKARELGARGYLIKSRFSYDELLQQVHQNVHHS